MLDFNPIDNEFNIKIDGVTTYNNYYTGEQLKDLPSVNSYLGDDIGLNIAIDCLKEFLQIDGDYVLESADGCDGEYVYYNINVNNTVYEVCVIWEDNTTYNITKEIASITIEDLNNMTEEEFYTFCNKVEAYNIQLTSEVSEVCKTLF